MKLSRSRTYNSKDDYDLFISNANTHDGLNKNLFFSSINFSLFFYFYLEYKDNSDLISRNASVIFVRRIRGTVDTLTSSTNEKSLLFPLMISSNGKDYFSFRKRKFQFLFFSILLLAILNQNPTISTTTPSSLSSVVKTNAIPLEQLAQVNKFDELFC